MKRTTRTNTKLATALTLVLLTGASAALFAEERTLAEWLQGFPRTSERSELKSDIRFLAEDGATSMRGVRCGTRPVGQLERVLIDAAVDQFLQERGPWHRYGELNIPVVFHLVRTHERVGHVKKKQAKKQIRVLNRAFAPHGIRFSLQAIKRYKHDEFTHGCVDAGIERDFKMNHAVDPAHTLNVYTCEPEDGILGYSYPPWDFSESSYMHGVVLLYSTLPKGSARPYNLGDTLTHEIGHYLGLLHTFEGGCSDGDRVADTPAVQSPAFGCPLERDTCSSPGSDPVRNFMDYTDDSCMNHFTSGQGKRMRDLIATFRGSL